GEVRSLVSGIDMKMFESEQEGPAIAERLEQSVIELKDICESFEDFAASIDSDPAALARTSERMNQYYDAVKRFRVKNADELVDLRDGLQEKLRAIDYGDSELPELEREYKAKGKVLKERADLLSASRHRAAQDFSAILNETARPLGLKNMEFGVSFQLGKLTPQGQDRVEFICSFNKNQLPGPVAKIASGGEISRLMLSLKRILASRMHLPTIIFDEVDTGVSGEIADKMGEMMVAMSRDMQVMTITHLPQVAAKGRSHFKVYKRDGDDKTNTHVRELTPEERVREIAGMMSGTNVTEAALGNARDLLKNSATS
ncbi:MAG: DNA repair protein RecN, partial [Muribaculaceae bacterium]|nr:DNA repair protein RecN [Muribaculaceae bacterium]